MFQQKRTIRENILNMKQIENEALDLPEDKRAELAQKLIPSLDASDQDNFDEEWLLEAQRRAQELDDGVVQPIPAEEVRKKAQALLRLATSFIQMQRLNILNLSLFMNKEGRSCLLYTSPSPRDS